MVISRCHPVTPLLVSPSPSLLLRRLPKQPQPLLDLCFAQVYVALLAGSIWRGLGRRGELAGKLVGADYAHPALHAHTRHLAIGGHQRPLARVLERAYPFDQLSIGILRRAREVAAHAIAIQPLRVPIDSVIE